MYEIPEIDFKFVFILILQDAKKKSFNFNSRHSTDALDTAATVQDVGSGVELIQITSRSPPITAAAAAALRASSSVASDDQYKSLDRFGSMDSSDTFLSCNTHPFPSQGSLAGLEELAAVGSMAANGSMPAVNIPGFNNGVIVNPFDPTRGKKYRGQITRQKSTPNRTLTPSPQDSPHTRRHQSRLGLGGRSASSDVEMADFESDFSAANREAYHEEVSAPKHKRARVSQVKILTISQIYFLNSNLYY